MSCLQALASFLVCRCVLFWHPFLRVRGIYEEFGFGLAPFRWGYGLGVHCDFGNGLFSVPSGLSGRKESRLRYEAVQHCGGVVWSVSARIFLVVAKPPSFCLSYAHTVRALCRHLPQATVGWAHRLCSWSRSCPGAVTGGVHRDSSRMLCSHSTAPPETRDLQHKPLEVTWYLEVCEGHALALCCCRDPKCKHAHKCVHVKWQCSL